MDAEKMEALRARCERLRQLCLSAEPNRVRSYTSAHEELLNALALLDGTITVEHYGRLGRAEDMVNMVRSP